MSTHEVHLQSRSALAHPLRMHTTCAASATGCQGTAACLLDDGAGVQLSGGVVRSGADDLHAALVGAVVGLGACARTRHGYHERAVGGRQQRACLSGCACTAPANARRPAPRPPPPALMGEPD